MIFSHKSPTLGSHCREMDSLSTIFNYSITLSQKEFRCCRFEFTKRSSKVVNASLSLLSPPLLRQFRNADGEFIDLAHLEGPSVPNALPMFWQCFGKDLPVIYQCFATCFTNNLPMFYQ